MSSIQEIREALEDHYFEFVDGFVAGDYNEDDVLSISRRAKQITLKADARHENIKAGKTTELYELKSLVRTGDNGQPETDVDKVSEIANKWLYVG